MKNPQPVTAALHPVLAPADGVPAALIASRFTLRPARNIAVTRDLPAPALTVLEGKTDPNIFLDFLKYAKYTPEQIERIHQLATKVAQLATTVGWIVGAVFTIKDVLKLVGVLDKDTEAERVQKDIALKVDAMYTYLRQREEKDQYELAVTWRGKVQGTRSSIANLALSRSQDNLDTLRESIRSLMDECLHPMLDVGMGEIPFIRTTHGGFPTPHTYVDEVPTHWTEYAFSLWMQTTTGAPVNLGYAADLAAEIWDPGYYLDVLVEGVGVFVAALAALEPAFRSTGYNRDDLRRIHRGLTDVVARWEVSLFQTAVAGPIDPNPGPWGDHRIYHPWIGGPPGPSTWQSFGQEPGLPVGAIDPVSGVSAFDPFWRDGLDLRYNSIGNYWYVADYAAATAAAYERRAAMLELVRERSGIRRLRALRDSVGALIGPPSGSEFAQVSDATFERRDITTATNAQVTFGEADEYVDLGVIGTFAGKPGKKYAARRAFQPAVKRFRLPMARRTDVSKIQLGYRLRFSVGPGSAANDPDPPIDESATLSAFSATTIPEQVPPVFPSSPPAVADLRSDRAGVYDVLQSDVFSLEEENLYEASGAVPGKHRLYLDRREGKVAARVKVEFEFDATAPGHPFMGFANVTVGTLDGATVRDGFILYIEVFETRVAALDNPPRDEVREETVAAMTLHFAPSFLVVEADYFKDREAGLAAIEAAVDSVEGKYSKSKMLLGPLEPITQVQRVAQEQEMALDLFAEYTTRSPELAQQLTERFAAPALQHG